MFKLVLIHQSDERAYHFLKAERELTPPLKGKIEFHSFDAWKAGKADKKQLMNAVEEADFLVLLLHGGLAWFPEFSELEEKVCHKKPFFFHSEMEEEVCQLQEKSGLLPEEYQKIAEYYELGGTGNFQNLIAYLLREFGNAEVSFEEPVPAYREGIWKVPECEEQSVLQEADAFEGPVIGILVHYLNALNDDTAHVAMLSEEIRKRGGFPLPVVSTMQPTERTEGLSGMIRRYLKRDDGSARIQGLIVTTGFSMTMLASPGKGREDAGESVFTGLGVPVFQAMTTYFSYEKWEGSTQGMDAMTMCSNIYEPELDGQIITSVIGCTEVRETEYGKMNRIVPVPDRIEKLAGSVVNWGLLSLMKSSEKRVAVLLHNMPPRMDMLGCAYGLDTPESVFQMVEVLKREGLTLDRDWKDGQEIIRELTEGLMNEFGYLSNEQIKERSADLMSEEEYAGWFEGLPPSVREEMERVWGKAPGDFMTLEKNILIPGIRNGNLFIGIQPSRESAEKAEGVYHSMEHPCPHQYLGYYHWIKEVFGANLIYHVGAHGTAEWLPGKSVGLSASCYPSIVLDELPHAYPYIMNLPGEGTQAKRRASAVLISHMVPAMKESGIYGDMEVLEDKLEQYENAMEFDKSQGRGLLEEIRKVAGGSLHLLSEEEIRGFFNEPDAIVNKLHSRLEEIRHSQIRDGLHVLGKIPEKERMDHLLDFLELGGGDRRDLIEKVLKIPEELDAVINAFHGRFIKPGASGCPSRGAYEALPTGRNFYGVHPFQIPTREAWRSGEKLARQLLHKTVSDLGKAPEAVTIVIYSGETMKTYGTTIAEVLYLYGVRPKWFPKHDRVCGVEAIPAGELDHPRIDVTLRVSGLFRDNFPNLMELLDEAVNLAASEEEPDEFNYIRKHINRDIRKLISRGMEQEQARKQASARIFSCPPGQYGAGINLLISSGKWEGRKELGDAYLAWSAFAYGQGREGIQMADSFADRMKDSQVVLKNLSSVEEDLLDSDDFYNYFGGAIAAAEAAGGSAVSYTVSSSDGKEEQIRTTKEELERLVRTKLLNPSWIQGLMEHGYRGAQEMSAMFDITFGWDASTGNIDGWVYEGLVQTYLADETLKEWIKEQNPWAVHNMSGRLLEAYGRGMWDAEEESLTLARDIYLEMEGSLEDMG
ncbi:cobaltochelatase subunit CobN [Qiania dongpingensis]|uniref:Cobaltochelatase subunit CobN n=1 Tax=Qiania dongpingensis TaxID=2763669 RepID=A0A7G9G4H6_9FIRM|nr:cobaltochelatase subunit CobN [Qiania dongpingensis]QNM05708.1 cobaltochelatase subunit CobN [Qiania dongpingensis]